MWTSRQEQNNTAEGLKTTLWKQTKTADFWAAFLEQPGPPLYHDLQQFVQIYLVLVLSSVPCERLFHKMNLQKDLLKTRMSTDLLDDNMMITENGFKCQGVDSPELDDLIQRAFVVFNSRKQRNPKKSHTAERPERLNNKRTCDENILLERAADFSSDDVSGDEDTVIDDSLKADLEGVVTCDCGAMDNVIDLDLIFSKMYTLVDRNILVSPDGWAPIPYASKLTGIDEIMKVNQQSVTDMRIAVQYESGWNFSGWVVGVEKGNCDHYQVCVRIYVHVYVVSMKWYYLTYRITIFGDSI
jgi:hypothetical protein